MNYIKKLFFPFLLAILFFSLLYTFRNLPASKLWENYSALYVPLKTDGNLVHSILDNVGCKETISYYNQQIPFYSEFLPINTLDPFNYLINRNSYFFDKGKNVMIYYIPDEYNNNASKAVSILINKHQIDAGLDCKSSFPIIIPILCIIVFLIFLFSSKNKLIYFSSGFFSLFYIFSMPFYLNACCVCLFFYILYLIQKYWQRKNSFNYLFSKKYLFLIFLIIIVFPFFSSPMSGFLFILSMFCSYITLKTILQIQNEIDSKRRFNPNFIIPAEQIKIFSSKEIQKSVVNIITTLLLLIFYFSSTNLFTISNAEDLYFPMPTRYNSKTEDNKNYIPNLNDFVIWSWNTITFPFKSLNSTSSYIPKDNEEIKILRYENSEQGIQTKEEVLYSFDESFKNNILNCIDDFDYPAIEKLMKKQKEGFIIDYSKGLTEKFKFTNIILMLVIFLIPCIMVITYLIGRKKYDEFI